MHREPSKRDAVPFDLKRSSLKMVPFQRMVEDHPSQADYLRRLCPPPAPPPPPLLYRRDLPLVLTSGYLRLAAWSGIKGSHPLSTAGMTFTGWWRPKYRTTLVGFSDSKTSNLQHIFTISFYELRCPGGTIQSQWFPLNYLFPMYK